MAASERARELVRAYAVALLKRWPRQVEREHAALLAYVATLEAVAQAVRDWRLAPHRHDRRAAMQRASDGLAALDRPEDGEHGDQG